MNARINFVGDISLFRQYEKLKIDPLREIWLPDGDSVVGNFEFIISDNRKPLFFDVVESYSCSYDYFKSVKEGRFHSLGLANNHCMDYGIEGVNDTIDVLSGKGVKTFGFSKGADYSPAKFEINGLSFCIVGCVKDGRWSKRHHGHGPDEYDVDKILEVIRQYRNRVDHVIIYPHWGTELVDIPRPEDVRNARRFIDEGATAVIGHHPHVPQGIEEFKGGLIAYSLGSFVYIPEEEIGFSAGHREREISICLNIEFGKGKIIEWQDYYYRYDSDKYLPLPVCDDTLSHYVKFIKGNIESRALYYKKIRRVLLKRELLACMERFKADPVRTLFHYVKYLRLEHLKRLVS